MSVSAPVTERTRGCDFREIVAITRELQTRYELPRAIVLMSRLLQKALYAGNPDEVMFWALVFHHYRGAGSFSEQEFDAFREKLLASLFSPTGRPPTGPPVT